MINRIGTLNQLKHPKVYSIRPDATVLDAILLMAEKDIGFLVVLDNNKIVGVLSERDYARKVRIHGKTSDQTQVREIMSTTVWTITPQDSLETAMALMATRKIRHIPVVENGKLVGVISMRNVMEAYLGMQRDTIQFLEEMALDR
jgi:CBS domain-containing protein